MSNASRFRRPLAALVVALAAAPAHTQVDAPLAPTLAATGLFEPGSANRVRAGNVEFAPRHALWTDGLAKRRWIYLPPGTTIDTSDPDRWEFPRGTRAWKEFSAAGRVETRLIERLSDGSWRFASYVWNAEGTEATLAPVEGIPQRGIPSRQDCLACHEGAPTPILGLSAVQQQGVRGARDPSEAQALGYLHANCGHCHNAGALEATGLFLAQSAADPHGSAARTRASAAAHAPELLRRAQSSNPYVRMPPLGVSVTDERSVALIERWIHELQPQGKASR